MPVYGLVNRISFLGSRKDEITHRLKSMSLLGPTFSKPGDAVFFGGQQQPKPLDLSGEWHFLPYNDAGRDFVKVPELVRLMQAKSPVMKLPSNWFLMGEKHYPPEATVQPLPLDVPKSPDMLKRRGLDHNGTVWFTREFDWQVAGNKPAILDLDMVDYYAQVFINGKKVGKHEGYFQAWSLDVSKYLNPGKNNIALRITASSLPLDTTDQMPMGWPNHRDQIKGVREYHDTRPGGSTMLGQQRSTGGLIRGIQLRESSGLDIANLKVTPVKVNETSAMLEIESTFKNWTDKPIELVGKGKISPHNFNDAVTIPLEFNATAKPGLSKVVTQVEVPNPRLWWTWDLGKPNLYQLDLSTEAPDGSLLAQQQKRFGIRSIDVDKWQWKLNGHNIYPRGSNYISSQWLSQVDKAWYQKDVSLLKDAHLNTLRVHAQIERPEFYDAADEAGMLVWQDFPLIWESSNRPSFIHNAIKQARDMVQRLASHPSIAMWSMHNEPPHMDNPGMTSINAKENLNLDNRLVQAVKRLDKSRFVLRESGKEDGHPYHGWYYGNLRGYHDPKSPPNKAFISEYGAQALPGVAMLKKMFGALSNIWPLNQRHAIENLRLACFQPKPTFENARIQPGNSIEEFIVNSQQHQANYIRYTTELMRRNKGTDDVGGKGAVHFFAIDDAPAITWSVMDYERNPKLGYFALKQAMQPVLPSIAYDVYDPKKPLSLHVVNDRPDVYKNATITWQLKTEHTILEQHTRKLDIAADKATKLIEPLLTSEQQKLLADGLAELTVIIQDQDHHVLGENQLSLKDFIADPASTLVGLSSQHYEHLKKSI